MTTQRPHCKKCGKRMRLSCPAQSGKQRFECRDGGAGRKYCSSTTNPNQKAFEGTDRAGNVAKKPLVFKRTFKCTERFLVTSAQNATSVHKKFWSALLLAAEHLKAEIIVIPTRYKNPTSTFAASQRNEEHWAAEVQPYLYNARKKLGSNLMLMGDIKIQPTASSPLNALEALTHGESGIFGHTKLQMRTVPTPQGKLPKIITTTGACTVPNYTDSRAGKLGHFHHTLGAVMVEVRGKEFHLRQINADKETGSFIDLTVWYGVDWTKSGIADAPPALALAMGDTHVRAVCPQVKRATFGASGIVPTLKPLRLYWHDLLDGDSINHHHDGNPFLAIQKRVNGTDNAEGEVLEAIDFVKVHTNDCTESYIVPSNHDDFLSRYIMRRDWRSDPTNAEFYLETALALTRQAKGKSANAEKLSAFAYHVNKNLGGRTDIVALSNDQSHTVAGIEMGMHGDKGPNGARGSIKNLRRIGVKSIIGHAHSPGIDEGAYQVGTSTKLRLGYNSGPSSWLNTHCVVYANGKRCLINIIGGKWRLE